MTHQALLRPIAISSLLVTSVEPRGGKTIIVCAIAATIKAARAHAAVCKVCDTRCVRRREGLVSADAEFLAASAGSPHPLDLICPERFADNLPPAFCATSRGRPFDWTAVDRSLSLMSRGSELMVIEGTGGAAEPMDDRHTMLEVASWLGAGVVVVASAFPSSISQTVASIAALRSGGARIAGIVLNGYPAESATPGEEATLRTIEKWTRCPVLAVVPDEPVRPPQIPSAILSPIERVDWVGLARRS